MNRLEGSLSLWLCCLSCVVLASTTLAAEPITIERLLNEMVSRETLARFPQPPYTCSLASSYDRTSVDPEGASTWFANGDSNQWVRVEKVTLGGKEQRQYVLFDQAGPGAIVRIWSTWGPTGEHFANDVLRIYIDDNVEPTVEGPLAQILDSGLLAEAPLAQGVSPQSPFQRRGHNLYLPIPYAKKCKIALVTQVPVDDTANTSELYYQINFRTYPHGTPVESFSLDRLQAAKSMIDKVQTQLRDSTRDVTNAERVSSEPVRLGSGKSHALQLTGSRAVRQLQLRLAADDLSQALRSTVLKIEFDDELCVWVPVGEFFGTSYHPTPFKTWYTGSDGAGQLSCQWVMPFAQSVKIALHNLGTQDVRVEQLEAWVSDWKWDERSLHFNARWHELYRTPSTCPTHDNQKGAFDVNYITIKGQGVYVGDTLTIFNPTNRWWGEGDEKIYVDGEGFPSHFGTGTEDYYGYAWCRPETFAAPFHAQPVGNGGPTRGLWVNSRYRALDAIPFTRSLKFDMEMWHNIRVLVNYAPTAIYYARPGSSCNIEPDPEAATRAITRSPEELAGGSNGP